MDTAPDDYTLHAWLDGELDPVRQAEVDAWLRAHPDDAIRVRRWAADRDALRARLDPILHEPVPARLAAVVQAGTAGDRGRAGRWAAAMAAAVAVFALGVAVGTALDGRGSARGVNELADGGPAPVAAARGDAPQPWLQRAVLAHRVYVPEQRHPVEVSVEAPDAATQRAQEEHLARWLTRRLARPVRLFDLRAQGYQLVGGRLLPDTSAPGAQLMYQSADGDRVTVYLRQPETGTPASFHYLEQSGLGVFYWVDGTPGEETGYALTGALPRERLLALAEAVHRQQQQAAATRNPAPAAPGATAAPVRRTPS